MAELWRAEEDPFAWHLGLEIIEVQTGWAQVAATVGPNGLNSLGRAHGGFLFAVLDEAFALAVNSIAQAVALEVNVNFLAAAKEGDRLLGTATVKHRGRRSLVVDLRLENCEGRLLGTGSAIAIPLGEASKRPSS